MYNRYIPQSDGTFRRSQIPERPPSRRPGPSQQSMNRPAPNPTQQPVQNQSDSRPNQKQQSWNPPPQRSCGPSENTAGSVGAFLKGLLPQNFDTEDLIVVLLLLLMSGKNNSDQNAALMTLGIYLFL